MLKLFKTPAQEIKELADYTQGIADGLQNPRLGAAAKWLEEASKHICAGGFFGCEGGDECTSDHK